MIQHYPGEQVGDFVAQRHKRGGKWLWHCAHCRAEKTASFIMMNKTGMKHCACRKMILTPAELRVARLVGEGYKDKQIGAILGLSFKTVKHHLGRIYVKLNFRCRTQLAVWMYFHGQELCNSTNDLA